jgi:hypothetical protein
MLVSRECVYASRAWVPSPAQRRSQLRYRIARIVCDYGMFDRRGPHSPLDAEGRLATHNAPTEIDDIATG